MMMLMIQIIYEVSRHLLLGGWPLLMASSGSDAEIQKRQVWRGQSMMDDSDCFEPKSSIQSKHAFVLELNREIIRDPLSCDMIMRRESCLVSISTLYVAAVYVHIYATKLGQSRAIEAVLCHRNHPL